MKKLFLNYASLILFLVNNIYSQVNYEKTIDLKNIPLATQDDIKDWEFVKYNFSGLIGNTPGQDFLMKSNKKNNYQLIENKKKYLRGQLSIFNFYYCFDVDWNLHIIPNNQTMDILKRTMNDEDSDVEAWKGCGEMENEDVKCIEAEIRVNDDFFYNNYFKKNDVFVPFIHINGVPGITSLKGDTINVYGPWVKDKKHGSKPEIHPMELLWWLNSVAQNESTTSEEFILMSMLDISGKFLYDDKELWEKLPLNIRYRYAFEINPNLAATNFILRIGDNTFEKGKNLMVDSIKVLKDISGKTLINVFEPKLDEYCSINLEKLKKKENGNIIGYMDIYYKVGNEDDDIDSYGYVDAKLEVISPTIINKNITPFTITEFKIEDQKGEKINNSVFKISKFFTMKDSLSEYNNLYGNLKISYQDNKDIFSNIKNIKAIDKSNFNVQTIDFDEKKKTFSVPKTSLINGKTIEIESKEGIKLRFDLPDLKLFSNEIRDSLYIFTGAISNKPLLKQFLATKGFPSNENNYLTNISEYSFIRDRINFEVGVNYKGVISTTDKKMVTIDDYDPAEKLNNIINSQNEQDAIKYWGNGKPINIMWTFKAKDLLTNEDLTINTGMNNDQNAINIISNNSRNKLIDNGSVTFQIGESIKNKLIEIQAMGIINDKFDLSDTIILKRNNFYLDDNNSNAIIYEAFKLVCVLNGISDVQGFWENAKKKIDNLSISDEYNFDIQTARSILHTLKYWYDNYRYKFYDLESLNKIKTKK